MRGRSIVLAGLLLAPLPLAAAESESAEADDPPAAEARITPDDCRRLLTGQTADDTTDRDTEDTPPPAAYTPGVDVRGNKVAPADLPGSDYGFEMPDVMVIELSLDALAYMGIDQPGVEATTSLGRILVGKQGRARFDNRILPPQAQRDLKRACREALSAAPE